MTPEFVIQIIREALMTAFWLSAPLLAVGFVAGIVISLVQIVTSIQDSAFSTIPRLRRLPGDLHPFTTVDAAEDDILHGPDPRRPRPVWAVAWSSPRQPCSVFC